MRDKSLDAPTTATARGLIKREKSCCARTVAPAGWSKGFSPPNGTTIGIDFTLIHAPPAIYTGDVNVRESECAPAGTPRAVVEHLNGAINQAMARPEMKERMLNQGADALAGSPADLASLVQRELARFAKLVKAAGVKIE